MRPREPSQINMLKPYRPRCPKCGGLTSLARIEPSDEPDHDLRTFECDACGASEVLKIKFR
jgi:hypothetical protein